MARPTMERLVKGFLEKRGLPIGTNLENIAAMRLEQAGLTSLYKHQHRVGDYRIDFAFPAIRVALEIDGMHHFTAQGALKDALRDTELRRRGWLVLRVDDEHGGIEDHLLHVVVLIQELTAQTARTDERIKGIYRDREKLNASGKL